MKITEGELFDICYGAYQTDYPWTYLFQGETDDDTLVGVKRIEKILDVVVFRGSVTGEDWARNFCAVPVYRQGLGWLTDSFLIGLDAPFNNLLKVVGRNYAVLGHSRGAGEATDYAARMVQINRPPILLMALAPPRTGGNQLKKVLKVIPHVRAFENKGDPVCLAPPWSEHPYDMIDINVPPKPHDPWGSVAPHHSELYGAYLKAQNPMPFYEVLS